MLYREVIAVCSEIRTKHINTMYGQNVEFLSLKACGIYSDQWNVLGISFHDGQRQLDIKLLSMETLFQCYASSFAKTARLKYIADSRDGLMACCISDTDRLCSMEYYGPK